jgi:rubrerythrin
MTHLTVRDILEHAERIETESHVFYVRAAGFLNDPDARQLAIELSEEETKHFNHLRDLLNQTHLSSHELDKTLGSEVNLSDRVVKTSDINEESDADTILNVALEREKQTEALYRLYLTLTGIPDHLVRVFEDLRQQEVGHQKRILKMIEKRKRNTDRKES